MVKVNLVLITIIIRKYCNWKIFLAAQSNNTEGACFDLLLKGQLFFDSSVPCNHPGVFPRSPDYLCICKFVFGTCFPSCYWLIVKHKECQYLHEYHLYQFGSTAQFLGNIHVILTLLPPKLQRRGLVF